MTKRTGRFFFDTPTHIIIYITAEGMPCFNPEHPFCFLSTKQSETILPPADTSEIKSNAEIKQEFLTVV